MRPPCLAGESVADEEHLPGQPTMAAAETLTNHGYAPHGAGGSAGGPSI